MYNELLKWFNIKSNRFPLLCILCSALLTIILIIVMFRYWTNDFITLADEQRKTGLSQLVYMARHSIDPIVSQALNKTLSREEALSLVRDQVRRMIYKDQYGNNYIFMSSYDGTMLVQPFEPAKELTNQWDLKDAYGIYIIRELARTAQENPDGGFIRYYYPPPNSAVPQEKLAFAVGIPELNCYIGTGMYIQNSQKEQANILFYARLFSIVLVLLFLFQVLFALSVIIRRHLELAKEVVMRKKAEESLAKSEGNLRIVFNNISDAIFIHDYQGIILEVNDRMLQMYDVARDQVKGKPIQLFSAESNERYDELKDTWRRIQNGEIIITEWKARRYSDSTPFYAEVALRNSIWSGEEAIFAVVRDISDRKQTEEERKKLEGKIQQAQKLESLGVLAGGIAHDFNNILMAIVGYTDLTLAVMPPLSPERNYIVEVEKASRRAAELCRQMLAYSGKGRFVIQAINLNDLIHEMTEMLQVSISKKAAFYFNAKEDLPAIEGDSTQIRQIVMNLIINASESLEGATGNIIITTGSMFCDVAYLSESWMNEELPAGCYVYFEVMDTGSGMDHETIAKIYDPFFTTKFAGRGLGLAAVLGIVRGHRGTIKVYSEPGKGSSFRVFFPAASHIAPTAEKPLAKETQWRGTGTILLVDDEISILDVGSEMLELIGYQVLTASNGKQALAIYEENKDRIVCVILDLTMPQMDGAETFAELRKIKNGVQVLLSSGYNEQEVTQQFVGQGLAGFIQKPYQIKTLEQKLMETLS